MSVGGRRLLAHTIFEVIPMKDTLDKARALPPGSTVSVTASPDKGMPATVELCESLAALGHRVVPHIAARMIGSEAELRNIVARLGDAGCTRAFVVGGDAQDGSTYPDGVALLRALHDMDHPFTEMGVAAYPEGHPSIPEGVLRRALLEKQPLADYMATQMCFDAGAIERWLGGERAAGVTLPLVVGVPGVTDPVRLMSIGARIGVGQSLRYLRKNRSVWRLLRPGPYDPSRLVARLARLAEQPDAGVVGLHIFTFNQIAATVAWYEKAIA